MFKVMPISFLKGILKQAIIISVLLGFYPYLFAQEKIDNRRFIQSKGISEAKSEPTASHKGVAGLTPEEEKKLNELQKLARAYRQQGVEMQRVGNLEGATSFYQKAIELDSFYAIPYNDLGVTYEMQGDFQSAEKSYLKSIEIDPNYLSAYSNLALLYEEQRDLGNAAFYWQKRADLGLPDDPWTVKANRRLNDIRLTLGQDEVGGSSEKEVIGLLEDTRQRKSILREDDKALAKMHLEKAKLYYKKGDEVRALKEAINAKQIDSSDSEINEFVEKVQKRLLSR